MNTAIKYILLFFFYSAAGWLGESIYCSIPARKPINRGFLTGPLCPIYGTGALVMAIILGPLKELPQSFTVFGYEIPYAVPLIFVAGMVLCDIVEFITSVIMEKLFHARWWDYSNKKFNIQGRICLTHTFYWGIAALVFMFAVHPFVERQYNKIPQQIIYAILVVVLFVFVLDLINALRNALDVKSMMDKFRKLEASMNSAKDEVISRLQTIQANVIRTSDRFTTFMSTTLAQIEEFNRQTRGASSENQEKGKEQNESPPHAVSEPQACRQRAACVL